MKKIKNFTDFINENVEVDGFEDILPQENVLDDEFDDVQPQGEFDSEFKSEIVGDVEDEEVDDLLELIYNQKTESWENIGELDLPTNFETFQEWFMDEIGDDDTTTASMKEEGDEIVFHIPEDIYVKYLEEVEEDGHKDELDDIVQSDDFDEGEFDDEENPPIDFKGTFKDNRFSGINPGGEFPKDWDDE